VSDKDYARGRNLLGNFVCRFGMPIRSRGARVPMRAHAGNDPAAVSAKAYRPMWRRPMPRAAGAASTRGMDTHSPLPPFSPGLAGRGARDASHGEPVVAFDDAAAAAGAPPEALRAPEPGGRREPGLDVEPVPPMAVAATPVDAGPIGWHPVPPRGVPRAAIGSLGAALVGGVALALVLIGPGERVFRPVEPVAAPMPVLSSEGASTLGTVDVTADARSAAQTSATAPGNVGMTSAAVPVAMPAGMRVPATVRESVPEARTAASRDPLRVPAAATRLDRPAVATPSIRRDAPSLQPAPPPDLPPPPATRAPRQAVVIPSSYAPRVDERMPATQQTPADPTVLAMPAEPTPDADATPAPLPVTDDQQ